MLLLGVATLCYTNDLCEELFVVAIDTGYQGEER